MFRMQGILMRDGKIVNRTFGLFAEHGNGRGQPASPFFFGSSPAGQQLFCTARAPERPSTMPIVRSQVDIAAGVLRSSPARSQSLVKRTDCSRARSKKFLNRSILLMPSISAWIVRMFGVSVFRSDR